MQFQKLPQAQYQKRSSIIAEDIVQRIRNGELEAAERLCHQLAKQDPEGIEALDRFAMLHQARGDNKAAADYYRKAAARAQMHGKFLTGYFLQPERMNAPGGEQHAEQNHQDQCVAVW